MLIFRRMLKTQTVQPALEMPPLAMEADIKDKWNKPKYAYNKPERIASQTSIQALALFRDFIEAEVSCGKKDTQFSIDCGATVLNGHYKYDPSEPDVCMQIMSTTGPESYAFAVLKQHKLSETMRKFQEIAYGSVKVMGDHMRPSIFVPDQELTLMNSVSHICDMMRNGRATLCVPGME